MEEMRTYDHTRTQVRHGDACDSNKIHPKMSVVLFSVKLTGDTWTEEYNILHQLNTGWRKIQVDWDNGMLMWAI